MLNGVDSWDRMTCGGKLCPSTFCYKMDTDFADCEPNILLNISSSSPYIVYAASLKCGSTCRSFVIDMGPLARSRSRPKTIVKTINVRSSQTRILMAPFWRQFSHSNASCFTTFCDDFPQFASIPPCIDICQSPMWQLGCQIMSNYPLTISSDAMFAGSSPSMRTRAPSTPSWVAICIALRMRGILTPTR